MEVPNIHSLFTLGRAIDGFRIQEDLMMEDEVDGNEETKGLVHIAGSRFGVSEGCDLCVLGCVALCFTFSSSPSFQLPFSISIWVKKEIKL